MAGKNSNYCITFLIGATARKFEEALHRVNQHRVEGGEDLRQTCDFDTWAPRKNQFLIYKNAN